MMDARLLVDRLQVPVPVHHHVETADLKTTAID
jgi:hypothetical protein